MAGYKSASFDPEAIASASDAASSALAAVAGASDAASNALSKIAANSSAWAGSSVGSFGVSIDGAGSVITTGIKQYLTIPFACTITGWSLVGAPSGSVVMDVWKASGALPTISNSITGTEKPTLSTANVASDSSLSTWTTSVQAGDIIAFNIDSCLGCSKLTLTITVTK